MTEQPDSIDLDEVVVISAMLPDGIYDVKLIDLLATTDREGRQVLKPTFEVLSGPHKGATQQGRYLLHVFPTKKGTQFCPGALEIKRDAMEVGVANLLPKLLPLNAADAKRAYHKAFKGARLRMAIQDGQPNKTDGKVYKEIRLLSGSTPDAESAYENDEDMVY